MLEGIALTIVVKPLDKGGDKSDLSNFRLLPLTNHLTKIFECILHSALVTFFNNINLYNYSQHGFFKHRSKITQLISYFESILSSHVDVIHLDAAKAFNRFDHNILPLKLKRLNIQGNIIACVSSILKNREQIF